MSRLAGKRGLFCIVGGPGVGKTKVVEGIAARGYPVLPEVATPLIRQQEAIGGIVLPSRLDGLEAFQRAVYHMQIAQEIVARRNIEHGLYDKAGPVFSDRSFHDGRGYLAAGGLDVYELILLSARDPRNRQDAFFVLDLLPAEFYEAGEGAGNEARWESHEVAQTMHGHLLAGYRAVSEETGTPLITVPYISRPTVAESVAARIDFIEDRVLEILR